MSLQPVPSAALDRAALTNADQHKASAAEADLGLTRRGGKDGWLEQAFRRGATQAEAIAG